jgi:hypothetical protein
MQVLTNAHLQMVSGEMSCMKCNRNRTNPREIGLADLIEVRAKYLGNLASSQEIYLISLKFFT